MNLYTAITHLTHTLTYLCLLSVLSMSQPDVNDTQPKHVMHSRVEQEKKEREHFLSLGQQLAKQVTQQTKRQAGQ